jgi:5-methylcytosine-specific restriction endonuclease McrA
VFDRDNYMCQKCNKSWAKITLNAHHIIHFAKDKSQRYNIDNWITLCIDCHRLEHSHKF